MFARFLASQFSGYLSLALIVSLAGAVFYIRNSGYEACEQDHAVQSIKIAEERNEIANNRPDTDEFFNGLRSDPEW